MMKSSAAAHQLQFSPVAGKFRQPGLPSISPFHAPKFGGQIKGLVSGIRDIRNGVVASSLLVEEAESRSRKSWYR